MPVLSLKWRIGSYAAVVLLIAISVISYIAYKEFEEAMIDSLDYRLQSDTDTIQDIILEEGSLDKARNEIIAIAHSKTNPYRSAYKIWFQGDDDWISSHGKIEALLSQVINTNPDIEWENGFFETDFVDDERPLRLIWAKYTIQFEGESEPRQLNVFGSTDAFYAQHELAEFLNALLIIAGIVIWAGTAGLFIVLRWGLRPLERMIEKMEHFSGHPLNNSAMDPADTVEELRPFVTSWSGMLKRLSIAIQENKRFTADASHELRTPLALVKSTLQLARSQKRTPDFYENAIDESLEDLDRMNLLIDKLLELSRLDNTLLIETFKPVNIKKILRTLIAQYETIIEHSGKTLSSTLCDAQIQGDEIHLSRMLNNLLENAIQYSPEESTISVSMKIIHNSLKITVHDQGGTITPDEQAKIFNRFYRIDKARNRKSGGTGLGLAIAYETAHQHNGTITVSSSPETGTDFTITLPVSQK